MMDYTVNLYDFGSASEPVFLADSTAGYATLRRIYSECGWDYDEDDAEEAVETSLDLVEEDDDGTGLYRANDRLGQYIWLRPVGEGEYEKASNWLQDDPRVEEAIDAIEDAESLDALLDALNAVEDMDPDVARRVSEYFDRRDYPTFGGNPPVDETGAEDTFGVWSWDATRLLMDTGGCTPPYEIVRRGTDAARGLR